MNLALWAAAGSGVLVGAGIVASRFAVGEVPPLTLAMLRYAVGFACLVPFAWAQLRRAPPAPGGQARLGRDLAAMAAIGIGQFGILIALLNYGLQRLHAAEAALIFSLFPLLTLALSAALGHERFSWSLFGGVLVSITGVAVSLAPKLGGAAAGSWLGEAAVLAAAAIGALCSVLYRPYVRRYPTVPVSAYAMLASVVFLAAVALPEGWPVRIGHFSSGAWAAIAFIGITSAAGYFGWLYALKHESPTRVTVFLALNPVTAALLGWAALGEALHPASLFALALIAAGLWLATRRKTPQAA